jgi:hypothetical protein
MYRLMDRCIFSFDSAGSVSFGALKPASDRRFKTRQRQTESSSP